MVDSGDRDVEIWEEGAKAEASTEAIFPVSQEAAMLSGKSGVSRTKTSEVERRPRVRALERSSVLRRGPSESALPVGIMPSFSSVVVGGGCALPGQNRVRKARSVFHTSTQTQYLNVVPHGRVC